MKSKQELRLIAKDIRKSLDIEKISEELVSKIRKTECYINAENVMLFYPTKYEMNFLRLLEDDKNFYLPRVKGQDLEVCPYKAGDNLEKSEFKILEPSTDGVCPEILDLVIVPALMISKDRFRLGYGGGYYDRFLAKYGNLFKAISAVPKELVVQSLPVDEFDMQVDKILL